MSRTGGGGRPPPRMRPVVQIVGGVVLGLGLGAAIGLDPGLVFALYAVGLGVTLLCLGLLLPDDPGDAGGFTPAERGRG